MKKNLKLKLCLPVLLVPAIAFAVHSGYPEDPSVRCKYNPDAPPKQMNGSQTDAEYDFAYVSDYEHDDQVYRRRICNETKHRVWFDWKLTNLSGWAETGGTVKNELSYPEDPEVSNGPLKYDFKEMGTTGYKYKPIKPKKTERTLSSVLSGFVLSNDTLVPVELRVSSSYEHERYNYQMSNLSEVPVQIWWKEFFVFWRNKQQQQYDGQFQAQRKAGIWAKSASEEKLVLNPKTDAKWIFEDSSGTVEVQTLELQLYSSEAKPNPEKPDLSGVAAVYLPTGRHLIAGRQ